MARKALPISMENVILALLDEEPLHGYEIHHRMNQMPGINKIWNIKQALLYSKLDRLENSGFIEPVPDQADAELTGRVVFRLTNEGKALIMEWISTPVKKARDIRQDFLGKLIIARRYGINHALDLLQKQRVVCQSWYDHLLQDLPVTSADALDEAIVHSYRLYRDRATLHWLDHLEGQINKVKDGDSLTGG